MTKTQVKATTMLMICYLSVVGCQSQQETEQKTAATSELDVPAETLFCQSAVWSPDGTQLLLAMMEHNDYDLYVINSDGSNLVRLTKGPGYDYWPTWTPDGNEILFQSKRDDNGDIYRMDADGSNLERLTDRPSFDGAPCLSPDGQMIVFTAHLSGPSQIHVMAADGTDIRAVGPGTGSEYNPVWSPDGKQIAYYATLGETDSIFVMNADGSHPHSVCSGIWPSWYPDGEHLLYAVEGSDGMGIHRIHVNGTGDRQLIRNAFFGDISPDGNQIAFVRTVWRADSGWPAKSAVFTAKADGTEQTRIAF